ncbi:GNAT family N-acetyltransferase [Archangium lansingense]|uniref:GNAT family N-acetyltransferase n=1 Tax=Archangium lansingense TaxID=2995310 RepID=A0ABT4A8S3_9BACT|nr:GNAT family N-acetyltransferase [Archangium lansinium]MCY1078061.1 GNAT family N-acetyltransferase [Archangium lansinium]
MTSPLRIQIVDSEETHWAQVRQLQAETAMGGVPLIIQRSAQRALAYLSLGGSGFDVLAWRGERLVGFAHARIDRRMAYVEGRLQPAELFYGGDLRVATDARGTGVVRALFDTVREHCASRGVHQGWGLINQGNDKSLAVMTAGKHGQRTTIQRTFVTASRLLLALPSAPSRPVLEEWLPTDAELEALPREWSHRFLAPAPPPGAMATVRATYPELRFFRRRADGLFVTALWNPTRARQLRLLSTPPALRALAATWNLLRPLTRAHPFPRAGECIETVELAFAVRERLDAPALRQLLHEAHRMGGHIVNVIEDGLEARGSPHVHGPANRMRTHVLTMAIGDPPVPTCPPEVPVHVDLAFL